MGAFFKLLKAYRTYDPGTQSSLEILLLYPGIKAWLVHQLAHTLYRAGIPFFPRMFSEFSRWLTGIDIHPGAQLGIVIIDHGMGVVIGETAIVEDGVLIFQGVTLGGTSFERKKRHPTIRRNCVLGGGAKILGNITVGEGSRVGANSVVVNDVPPGSTVVGVPGEIVAKKGVVLGEELEHGKLPDPLHQKLSELEARLKALENVTR